jgi:membrane protein CcdC involved in cytochrome C biogenesis
MQAQTGQQSWIGIAVPIIILGLVMFRRIRSMGQLRPLKLETLWVVPTIYLVLAGLMFWQIPPKGWIAIASIIALAIGAAVGWQRGTMMHIHVDPETHALNQKASPAAMIFLIALVVVRSGAKTLLGETHAVSAAMLTDPLIAFALGMLTLTRVEMYLRAKRMLKEVRGRT